MHGMDERRLVLIGKQNIPCPHLVDLGDDLALVGARWKERYLR
jgi:hypothetical protein